MTHRLSVRHLFAMVPVVGVVVASARAISDNSFLWHVRAGTVQLDAGQVLRTDPFSFTAQGESWRTQSWIADLLYGTLERWTGDLSWVWPLVALTMTMTLVMVGLAVYREAGNPLAVAIVLFFTAWLVLRTLVPRPVVFSHLLLAALVVVLAQRRLRWVIPLLLWVWAGLHGSFVIGLGLIVLEALRSGRRELWGLLGLSAVSVSLTAHGLALWGVLGEFAASRGALDLIQEWAPPDLTDLSAAPYALFIGALLFAAARSRISPRDLIVVLPFLLFGLTSYRALIPATLVLAPWVARAIEIPTAPRRIESGLLNGAIAALVVVTAVWLGWERAGSYPDDELFPVSAIAALDPGPLFHGDAVGGYLIYEAWPDRLVYTDDRAELYGEERFEEFVDARAGRPVWREVFDRHGIDQALLSADSTGLQEVLSASGWYERYRDPEFVVLSR
ncbi:MAG: hypothetical protein HKO63_08640 [Acidimicrobiia bacterium]|nr:hypothetical protein [Acidimicrobiia bacterium]MBT8194709.1 hypothetical protein [Acidimicrobiia bacterium]NNF88178.1 hypothetical protein [Acidimicrobiia bacterium]NNL98256.1 hypothetical protein [Acidimicrobiia bacterium]RZV46220.1 MAG: hypothetical protein EX267_03785 [Acidimicrobiia bacterium]